MLNVFFRESNPLSMEVIETQCNTETGKGLSDTAEQQTWLQTTQPKSGGAVTTVTNGCANCVKPSRYQLPAMGARFSVFFYGWHCFSEKRVMSRQIQVRQPHTNKSGFAKSVINKYMVGSPYTSTYSSTRHNTNRKHNIHHTPYTNIQHTSTLKTHHL